MLKLIVLILNAPLNNYYKIVWTEQMPIKPNQSPLI